MVTIIFEWSFVTAKNCINLHMVELLRPMKEYWYVIRNASYFVRIGT